VTFFRRIRQRRSSDKISPIIQQLSISRRHESSNATTLAVPTKKSKKKSPVLFPWWCLFIAYTFSYLLIGISIVFMIARGIEFGDTRIQKWLTSMITGLFSSIILSQPIKVRIYKLVLMN
jgi:hypothetical protein